MRINIYQIDSDKDTNRVKFEGYEETLKYGGINPAIYKCVFHGDVDGDLEAVYCTFNHPDHPGTFQGHSLSLSDIIEVVDTETTPYGIVEYLSKDSDGNPYVDSRMFCDTQEEFDDEVWRCELNNEDISSVVLRNDIEVGSYFVDHVGFKKLDEFDTTKCAEMDGLRMLMIQPHRTPIVTFVREDIDDLQRAVSDHGEDSRIQYTYPFDDDCMVLGNDDAKCIGMEGNRRFGESIYAGPIFITRDNHNSGLCSLTDEQVQKYSEMFAEPQDISQDEVQADMGFTFIPLW
ncbi:MAG: DUF3846 domain-containing protein [Bacteroidaceae bacterium]|nr:DUF3846 domain-containing protein [Bacteroidaceae bacterium]